MAIPDSQAPLWLGFIENLLPWATICTIGVAAVDRVFKYFSAAQDVRLREIIQSEVSPDITKLTRAIDELRESIWHLKQE